jgi:hypothetical protein
MLEPELSLKLTLAMEPRPGATPQERANVAAVWKALSMTPQEQVQSLEQLQALGVDLKAMRQQLVREQSELGEARAQLNKSQSYLNAIGWGMSLAGVLLVAALLDRPWDRFRRAPSVADTWHDSGLEQAAASSRRPLWDEPSKPEAPLDLDLDLDFSKASAPAVVLAPPTAEVAPSQLSELGHTDFKHSSWRSLKSVEMHDLEQQADFFVSLGHFDRAIALLMSYVQASPETSELAWMALLDLHHRLNRQPGYEGLRDQIERRFNVRIPTFERYHEPTAGLEDYADTLARIVSVWPSAAALDAIEESIYRIPGANDNKGFELEAYRELLLLYIVGKEVIARNPNPEAAMTRPGALLLTAVQPLAFDRPWRPREDGLPFATLDGSAPLDIDVGDLSQLAADKSNGARPTNSGNLVEFDDLGPT